MFVIPQLRQRQGSLRLSPRWSNKKPVFVISPFQHLQASSLGAASYTSTAGTATMGSYGLNNYAGGDGVGIIGATNDISIRLTVDSTLAARLQNECTVLSVIGALPTTGPAGNMVYFCRGGTAGDPAYFTLEAGNSETVIISRIWNGGYDSAMSAGGQQDLTHGISALAQTWGRACERGHMAAMNGRVILKGAGTKFTPQVPLERIDIGVGMYRIPIYFHVIFNSTFTEADLAELTSRPFSLFDSGIAQEFVVGQVTAYAQAGADVIAAAGIIMDSGAVEAGAGASVSAAAYGGMWEFFNPTGYSPPTSPITLDFNEISFGVSVVSGGASGSAEPTMYTYSPPANAEAGAEASAVPGLVKFVESAFEAGATVEPLAYRILRASPAIIFAEATGSVDLSGLVSGRIIRNAKVRVRAEATFNAYPVRVRAARTAMSAGATGAATTFVSLGVGAAADAGATTTAVGTQVFNGASDMAAGADVAAYPWARRQAAAAAAGGADGAGTGRTNVHPGGFLDAGATVTAVASVTYLSAAVAAAADATVVANGLMRAAGAAAMSGEATATATAVLGSLPEADIAGEAVMTADALRSLRGSMAMTAGATVTAVATNTKQGAAAATANSSTSASAWITFGAAAAIGGTASVTSFAVRNLAIPSPRGGDVGNVEPREMLAQLEKREMWVVPNEIPEPGRQLPADA